MNLVDYMKSGATGSKYSTLEKYYKDLYTSQCQKLIELDKRMGEISKDISDLSKDRTEGYTEILEWIHNKRTGTSPSFNWIKEFIDNMSEYINKSHTHVNFDTYKLTVSEDNLSKYSPQNLSNTYGIEDKFDLYVLGEIYSNGFKDEFLLILSLISIFLGILVVISKNPIISVLFLIGLFMSISFYLMFLGLNFLGLSYLLVYIGAVSILFLFILMLINVRVSELLSDTYNSIVLSVLITIYFSFSINQIMPYNISGSNNMYENIKSKSEFIDVFSLKKDSNNELFYTSFETWDNNLSSISNINSIGNVLYTNYSIWLILTSIILLLAMVGCIIITIKQK